MANIQTWRPFNQSFIDPFRAFNDWGYSPSFRAVDEDLDVYEEDGKVFAEASLPGMDPKDVDITYENGTLYIHAESTSNGTDKKSTKRKDYKTNRTRHFDYVASLPRPVDADKLKASLKNEVLTVKAPVSKQALPKQIQVSA